MEFLVKGATEYNEPGVFMAFEETGEDLTKNVASLGFDLDGLTKKKKLAIDYVYIERSEIEETGEYDLEGLFVRLDYAIDSIQAKRVVLDTIEVLFGGLPNEGVLRAELRRLFRWLKDKGVTALITGERGETSLTRYGLEEYVADCVILLDHRLTDQISTRRLRIVKYRGSSHGTNEYPFLIDEEGISVLPVTSLGLELRCAQRAHIHRHTPPRHDVWRQGLLQRLEHTRLRHRGNRQNDRSPPTLPKQPARRVSAASTSPSKNHPSRSRGTWLPSA